ncbi:MAG: hypothetical protein ABEK50_04815 [bacterium]
MIKYRFGSASLLLLSLLIVTSILFTPQSLAAESFTEALNGNLKLRVYYNDVTGNQALSFKTPGLNYLSDLTMTYNKVLGGNSDDAIRVNGLVNFRGTDDPQYQVRKDTLRLQNAYVTAEKRDQWKFTGGYFNQRFTSYTMSTSLLGINSYYALTKSVDFYLFTGRDRRARPNNQYARFAGGSRLAWSVNPQHSVGLSYVRTEDQTGSLSGDERSGVGDTVTNGVVGLDYTGSFDLYKSNVEAEVARSNVDTAPNSQNGESSGDLARRLSIRNSVPAVGHLQLKYEKVDPGFKTVSGFATADRQRYSLSWRSQFENVFGERWYFRANYENWEDGLESPRQHSVQDWVLEATHDPQNGGFFNSVANFSIESREDEGSTAQNDANESDRMVYSVTSENRLGESSLDLDYSYEDRSSDSQTLNRFETTLDHPFELSGFNMNYTFDGVYEVESDNLGPRETTDKRFKINNEVVVGENTRENIRLRHGYQEEDAAGAGTITRTTLGLSFDYLFNRTAGNKVSLSYLVNDNDDEGDPTQNYKEETIDMRVDYSF